MEKPLDCAECLEKIDPYLDRELSSAEFEEVRVHLERCGGCGSEFVVERVFVDRLRGSATSTVAPPGVRERLILRIRQDVGRSP